MYFLEQIKSQFISQIALYNIDGLKGSVDGENNKPTEDVEGGEATQAKKLAEKSVKLGDDMKNKGERFSETRKALKTGIDRNEKDSEITPVSSKEALFSVKATSPEEKELARKMGKTGESPEDIKEAIFQQRVDKLASNKITDGEREVIEKEFISEIASESGVSAELIGDLRALGFEGSQDWAEGDVAANLKSMTEDLQRMKEQIEKEGGKFPETKEEFMALYEAMNQNDGISDQEPMTSEEASAAGVDVVDSGDGIGIDPNGQGVQTVGDTVIAPNGSYSRGGNVYPAQRIQGSGPDVPPSSVTEGVSHVDPNNNSSPELESYSNEHNKEIIRKMVPAEWHGAAIEMAKKVGELQEGKVIALASMGGGANSQGPEAIVCYPNPEGEVHTFPIIVGASGYGEGVSTGDKKTPVNTLFNFNSGKVAGRGNDASQGGSSTVLGGAAYSPEAAALGGRWWHGVADHRIPGGRTHGCIGAKQENMISLASAINRHGGGYGMNLVSKQG